MGRSSYIQSDIYYYQALYGKYPKIVFGKITEIEIKKDKTPEFIFYYFPNDAKSDKSFLGCEYEIGNFDFGYYLE